MSGARRGGSDTMPLFTQAADPRKPVRVRHGPATVTGFSGGGIRDAGTPLGGRSPEVRH